MTEISIIYCIVSEKHLLFCRSTSLLQVAAFNWLLSPLTLSLSSELASAASAALAASAASAASTSALATMMPLASASAASSVSAVLASALASVSVSASSSLSSYHHCCRPCWMPMERRQWGMIRWCNNYVVVVISSSPFGVLPHCRLAADATTIKSRRIILVHHWCNNHIIVILKICRVLNHCQLAADATMKSSSYRCCHHHRRSFNSYYLLQWN